MVVAMDNNFSNQSYDKMMHSDSGLIDRQVEMINHETGEIIDTVPTNDYLYAMAGHGKHLEKQFDRYSEDGSYREMCTFLDGEIKALQSGENHDVDKNKLKEVGFDYVALGHIHKLDYNTEKNQNIIYPGSTIAMGFDELGKHGFIVGNIEKEKLELAFIPVDKREFKELEFDITEINDEEELIEKINNIYLDDNNLYKIILIGMELKRKWRIKDT